jgi:hypothetical protein
LWNNKSRAGFLRNARRVKLAPGAKGMWVMRKLKHNNRAAFAVILAVAILLSAIALGSCTVDTHSQIRPYNFANTVWVSDNPRIWFHVGADDEESDVEGQLITESKVYHIIAAFDYGTAVDFIDGDSPTHNSGSILFSGDCKFSKKEMVVTVKKDYNSILNLSVEEITFTRFDDEEKRDLADVFGVSILREGSYFERYEIADEKVCFYSQITLRNKTDIDKKIQLDGDFFAYQIEGLVKEEYIQGKIQGGDTDFIEIGAHDVVVYNILFCGEFAGKDFEVSRALPHMKINYIK